LNLRTAGRGGSNSDQIADWLAHELTHVIHEQFNSSSPWPESADGTFDTWWRDACKKDGLPTSNYGATHSAEDLAEFGKLYFNAYNSPDKLADLQAAAPERFRAFEALIAKEAA
jgi:hypothetical protein